MTGDDSFRILCLETGNEKVIFEGITLEKEQAYDISRALNDWGRRKRLYVRKVDPKDADILSEWVHQDQRNNNQTAYRVVIKKRYN